VILSVQFNTLVALCVSILQDGITRLTRQQQRGSQQPQQQHQQPAPLAQQQQAGQAQLQQQLLHFWSLVASLLKLPVSPAAVTGWTIIQGCTTVARVGLEALQHIMLCAELDASIAEHRYVLAPWLALTGRSYVAQVGLLRAALSGPPPAYLSPLIDCVDALQNSMDSLPQFMARWASGFSSSSRGNVSSSSDGSNDSGGGSRTSGGSGSSGSIDGSSGSSNGSGSAAHGPNTTQAGMVCGHLQQLLQQLKVDKGFAADGGRAAVAAAVAAATSSIGYVPP
jgi:uncharacterized membrane protein YgcG